MTNLNDVIFQDPFADAPGRSQKEQTMLRATPVPVGVKFRMNATIDRFLWPTDNATNDDAYAIIAVYVDRLEKVETDGTQIYTTPKTNDYGNITVKGPLGFCKVGQDITLTGQMVQDSKGLWMRVERFDVIEPASAEEMKYALSTGIVKGIGPDTAGKIVAEFGDDTYRVMDEEIEKLLKVNGIAKKKLAMITESWERQRTVIKLVRELGDCGVSAALALKAYKEWSGAALDIIKENPYKLTRLHGVGFTTADKIALGMGIAPDDIKRVEAGILHVFEQQASAGHVYLPADVLFGHVNDLFRDLLRYHPDAEITVEQIESAIKQLENEETLVLDSFELPDGTVIDAIYTRYSYSAEVGLSEHVLEINGYQMSKMILTFNNADWATKFKEIESGLGFTLAPTQKEAITTALTSKITVLTGGGGTGKTTITKAVTDELRRLQARVALCSPTGKAATRLEEATGMDASTVHRLLGATGSNSFSYDATNQLDIDYLIVDEASMLDVFLAHALFAATPKTAHILLVGDVNQLPSVGAGAVLSDFIKSGVVPVVRLDTIFRQGKGSLIVTNADRINRGVVDLETHNGVTGKGDNAGDYYHIESPGGMVTQKTIIDLVTSHIPNRMGFKPNDIQILAPMKRGDIGVIALNKALQEKMNPARHGKVEHTTKTGVFRVGDKIIQTRNNYDQEVFNGETGIITMFDEDYSDKGAFKITFGTGKRAHTVYYESFELSSEIMLAYALTIHKSQGSEYPCVVLVMSTDHYIMLARNLAYTGLTRAKQTAIVVGQRKAVAVAIKNDKPVRRYTGLQNRLRDAQ